LFPNLEDKQAIKTSIKTEIMNIKEEPNDDEDFETKQFKSNA
jgi:hypothetical protein